MYQRPPIPGSTYADASGAPIPYGHRWGAAGPPAESYSVTAHPERFAPLHDVADALMAALGVAPTPGGAVFGPQGPSETRRFDATTPDAAPLVIGLTTFPGVRVRAGSYYSAAFPACGCDACDEDVLETVELLEQTVLAVTSGSFREWSVGDWVHTSLTFESGSRGGASRIRDVQPALLDPQGTPLAPRAWRPWAGPQGS